MKYLVCSFDFLVYILYYTAHSCRVFVGFSKAFTGVTFRQFRPGIRLDLTANSRSKFVRSLVNKSRILRCFATIMCFPAISQYFHGLFSNFLITLAIYGDCLVNEAFWGEINAFFLCVKVF